MNRGIVAGTVALLLATLLGGAEGARAGTAEVYRCGLTKAPPGGGIAAPLRVVLNPAADRAQVSDPMTTFYAGGPVTARLTPRGAGWRLDWRIDGVGGDGAAPHPVDYRAEIAADGALTVRATPVGGGKVLRASGTCYAG
ncbi:hypothetical protein [Acidimangrovimonas sediminis]|uniref:hypothetical protein n=1 Tax=Acidimangrovimonas sediminis TaxID=2056283 RepID=UPI000C800772|nr:hypothetical protein [Acidimangrovimonas sediminis]